jgi:phosphate transport system substrate-binding protein
MGDMTTNTNITRGLMAVAASAALATGVAACGGDDNGSGSSSGGSKEQADAGLSGQMAGAGSSAQAAAQEAWTAGFQQANKNVTVSYDPIGSGGGREQFNSGGTLFGGTDSAFKDDELTAAQKRCGGADNFIEAPVYISPIAVIYNLAGVDALQLKPATIAKIFSGKITKWDDPAIKADNPDAKLPDDRITVVHRSDDSGTTNNFTDYLNKAASGDWTQEASDTWPIKGQEAAEGTSGVVDAVQNGAGTIGYADASQAGELGKAKVQVSGSYLEPSPEAAAKIFDESKAVSGQGKYVFTYELNRTPKEGTYPIVLASYAMACTKYDSQQDAKNVKGYLKYVVSAEGQQAAAKNAGSAPLPDSVRSKVEPALDAIGTGSAS